MRKGSMRLNDILRHQKLIVAAVLVVVTFWVYSPVRHHEFLHFDDYSYVAGNTRIQQGLTWENVKWSMTAFEQALWKPLTLLSHMLDCQLFGLNPAGHLLMNLLIHGVSLTVLFVVLCQMTGAIWPSALVAALLALHPLNVESVAWVAERKNVLSTLFWVLTLWAYMGYTRRPNWKRYLGVMGVLVLGLMSKPMLVTLPCTLLLLDYWPLRRLGENWQELRERLPGLLLEKLPFFVPVALVSMLTLYGAETTHGLPGLAELSWGDRMGNALLGYGLYLKKMVWPVDLAAIYPHPSFSGSLSVGSVVFATLGLVSISLGVWWRRWSSRYLVVGWLWYLGTLIPVSGLLQSGYVAMADRYAYVPLIGVFVMLAWGVAELAQKNRQLRKTWLLGAGVGMLIVLATLTRTQLRHWENTTTLFEHALDVTSNNFIVHNGLGMELRDQGEYEKALEHFQEAVRIHPNYADGHNHLGVALMQKGQLDQALEHFAKVLRTTDRSHRAYNNIGMVFAEKGNLDEAIEYFQKALKINLENYQAHHNLGSVLVRLGRFEEAVEHFKEALKIDPDSYEDHHNLGVALVRQERFEEAIEHFQKTLAIDPTYSEADHNWGQALVGQGRFEEAVERFKEALKVTPDHSSTHYDLGVALVRLGRFEEALEQFREAVRIDPRYSEAHYNWGVVLVGQGRDEEAIEHFKEVVRIDPDYSKAHYTLGMILAGEGRVDEAIHHFSEAVRIDPAHREAQESLERLQSR